MMSDEFPEPAFGYVAVVTVTYHLPGHCYSARSAGERAAVLLAGGALAGQEQDRSIAVASLAGDGQRYATREDVREKADQEGMQHLLLGCEFSPFELPEGTPAGVTAAVTRLAAHGATAEVLRPKAQGGREELLEDFISLVTTFAGRLYGMRSAAARRRLPAESGPAGPGGTR